ncbi:MAG: hypothetical protein IIA00_04060 [Proteobacteria bacterium]|nr:hypothetical protein [Pseudomonadota bacterium]
MRTFSERSLSALLFMVLVSFSAPDARAAGFAKLCEIPSSVADPVRTELAHRRGQLTRERSVITREGKAFNRACKAVIAGSSKDSRCKATLRDISAQQQSHNQDVKAFCDKVAAAASFFDEDKELVLCEFSKLADVERKMESQRAHLKRLISQADDYTRNVEEWTALDRAARANARRKARGAVFPLILSGFNVKAKDFIERAGVDSLKKLQKAFGRKITQSIYQNMARQNEIRRATTEVVNAKKLDQMLSGLSKVNAGLDAARGGQDAIDARTKDEFLDASLDLLGGIAGMCKCHPALGLIVSNIKLWNAVVYGWAGALASRARLKQLLALDGQTYSESQRATERYIDLVKTRNSLRDKCEPVG